MGLQPILPYCTAFDLFDALSVEGVALRLDDDNSASGQWIYATAQAAIGATTIQCQPLAYAMAAGTTLDFSGANMGAIVEVVMAAQASVGATTLSIAASVGVVPVGAVAIDGGVNAAELARITKAISYAAAEINDYCLPRYQDPGQLATSWSVNRWATSLAARWLAKRCCRSCPAGLEEDYKEAKEALQEIAAASRQIGDLGTPVVEWPAWSNVTVDQSYWLRKARVERGISEATPVQGYAQSVDRDSELILEL